MRTIIGLLATATVLTACEEPVQSLEEPASLVMVAPDTATVLVGGQVQLTAFLRDSAGNVLPVRPVTWRTGNPSVATVAPASGGRAVVTGVSPGQTPVTVTSEGRSASATITVVSPGPSNGSIWITTSTTGVDPDPDGYTVWVDGLLSTVTVRVDGTVTISELSPANPLAPGDHQVGLLGMTVNCEVTSPNPLTVTVVAGDTAVAAFPVTCTPLTQLAFVRRVYASNSLGIYAVNSNGTGTTPLTTGANVFDGAPAWSPGGNRIAFDRGTADRSGRAIHVIDANGTVALTDGNAYDTRPAWSPDSRKIAFERKADWSGCGQIHVMNVDGTSPVPVTNQSACSTAPAWSPDGARIAFASRGISLMNPDGSAVTPLTDDPSDDYPAWSPDGARLAFSRIEHCDDFDGTCYYGIYTMNADGSNVSLLVGWLDGAVPPAWSPDGRWVAFSAFHYATMDVAVFAVSVGGGQASGFGDLRGDIRLITSGASSPAWRW